MAFFGSPNLRTQLNLLAQKNLRVLKVKGHRVGLQSA